MFTLKRCHHETILARCRLLRFWYRECEFLPPLRGKVRMGGIRILALPYVPSPCPSPARGEGTLCLLYEKNGLGWD